MYLFCFDSDVQGRRNGSVQRTAAGETAAAGEMVAAEKLLLVAMEAIREHPEAFEAAVEAMRPVREALDQKDRG